jgi:hypothetical protein
MRLLFEACHEAGIEPRYARSVSTSEQEMFLSKLVEIRTSFVQRVCTYAGIHTTPNEVAWMSLDVKNAKLRQTALFQTLRNHRFEELERSYLQEVEG